MKGLVFSPHAPMDFTAQPLGCMYPLQRHCTGKVQFPVRYSEPLKFST